MCVLKVTDHHYSLTLKIAINNHFPAVSSKTVKFQTAHYPDKFPSMYDFAISQTFHSHIPFSSTASTMVSKTLSTREQALHLQSVASYFPKSPITFLFGPLKQPLHDHFFIPLSALQGFLHRKEKKNESLTFPLRGLGRVSQNVNSIDKTTVFERKTLKFA